MISSNNCLTEKMTNCGNEGKCIQFDLQDKKGDVKDREMDKTAETKTSDIVRNAAFRLFLEKGYEATNLREIGAESGINASTIYFYYKSKKELFLDVLGSVYSTHTGQLRDRALELHPETERDGIRELVFLEIELFYMDSASYKLGLRYLLFPVMELQEEIREIHEKYRQEEFEIFRPYLTACADGSVQSEKLFFTRIRKLLSAVINGMIISGQAISRQRMAEWWEHHQNILFEKNAIDEW